MADDIVWYQSDISCLSGSCRLVWHVDGGRGMLAVVVSGLMPAGDEQ